MKIPLIVVVLGALTPFVAFAPRAVAQELLRTIPAAANDFEFGFAVAGGADLDGDGFDDVVVGNPGSPSASSLGGRVDVHSGANGAPLHHWGSSGDFDRFGTSVRFGGDVDGDGIVDVVIGAPQFLFASASQGGFVEVRSGATGAVLHPVAGAMGDCGGWSVQGGHDDDADGTPDFVFGANQKQLASLAPGYVRVVSGATGQALLHLSGSIAKGQFGHAVRFVGDANGDGTTEIAVSAANGGVALPFAGHVFVHAGSNGSLLWQSFGTTPDERFAFALCAPGDLDGDGRADLVFGSPGADLAVNDPGVVTAVRGLDGVPVWSRWGSAAGFGSGGSVGVIGDVDGDGFADLAAGNEPLLPFPRTIDVLSGRTGALRSAIVDPYGSSSFGHALDGAGDVNGDGAPELVVGAPTAGGLLQPIGAVGLVTFTCGLVTSIAAPCAPATNHPILDLDGCAAAAAAMTLRISNGPALAPGIVCASVSPLPTPIGNGCTWFVGTPFVTAGPLSSSGTGTFDAPIDLPPQAQHLSFVMQSAWADPNSATGFVLSDAVFVALP
ncbi:MAG: FG-GAP repeat protein [Planctomycetes bacterium]|nr:FG-GAP repeat protein [Planctomycetota bacterium]